MERDIKEGVWAIDPKSEFPRSCSFLPPLKSLPLPLDS